MSVAESSHRETTPTTHGTQSAPDSLVEEKQDGAAAAIEPEYATGLRLVIIMCTIFLSTLLTALDIVCISMVIRTSGTF
jgi:hypothetical protein